MGFHARLGFVEDGLCSGVVPCKCDPHMLIWWQLGETVLRSAWLRDARCSLSQPDLPTTDLFTSHKSWLVSQNPCHAHAVGAWAAGLGLDQRTPSWWATCASAEQLTDSTQPPPPDLSTHARQPRRLSSPAWGFANCVLSPSFHQTHTCWTTSGGIHTNCPSKPIVPKLYKSLWADWPVSQGQGSCKQHVTGTIWELQHPDHAMTTRHVTALLRDCCKTLATWPHTTLLPPLFWRTPQPTNNVYSTTHPESRAGQMQHPATSALTSNRKQLGQSAHAHAPEMSDDSWDFDTREAAMQHGTRVQQLVKCLRAQPALTEENK